MEVIVKRKKSQGGGVRVEKIKKKNWEGCVQRMEVIVKRKKSQGGGVRVEKIKKKNWGGLGCGEGGGVR